MSQEILFGEPIEQKSSFVSENEICNTGTPKQLEDCKESISYLERTVRHFDETQAYLQARYIRDSITLERLINEIFIKKFNFNLECTSYNKILTKAKDINFMEIVEKILSSIKLYHIILIKFDRHINIIFINNRLKTYYYYEPHGDYAIISSDLTVNIEKELVKHNYTKLAIADKSGILKQNRLPFCYIYCIHFFLNTIIDYDDKIKSTLSYECNNNYLLIFIRELLKLCYINNLVDNMTYYLLTNNLYKIRKIIETTPNVKIKNLFYMISSKKMHSLIKNNIDEETLFGNTDETNLITFVEYYIKNHLVYLHELNNTEYINIICSYYPFLELFIGKFYCDKLTIKDLKILNKMDINLINTKTPFKSFLIQFILFTFKKLIDMIEVYIILIHHSKENRIKFSKQVQTIIVEDYKTIDRNKFKLMDDCIILLEKILLLNINEYITSGFINIIIRKFFESYKELIDNIKIKLEKYNEKLGINEITEKNIYEDYFYEIDGIISLFNCVLTRSGKKSEIIEYFKDTNISSIINSKLGDRNESEMIKNSKSGYQKKYIKYKQKYLQLKNKKI